MVTPKEAVWRLEPHGQAKHDILRRYLEAWFPILASWNKTMLYLDGFAGPGVYTAGQPGSPIIALQVATEHAKVLRGRVLFCFIEEDADRIAVLQAEVAKLALPPNFEVEIRQSRFEDHIDQVLAAVGGGQLPIFAFVDPFGFSGLPFAVISKLLKRPQGEVLVTLMAEFMNRFLTEAAVQKHIVETFGTDEVLKFPGSVSDRMEALAALYQDQLSGQARFVRRFEMRNEKDQPLYYLYFASSNRQGHIRMKEAMWRVDPLGEFRFSDASDPDQLVMYADQVDLPLAEALAKRFAGRMVRGFDVRLHVEDETPYLNRHKTAALGRLEADRRLRVEGVQANGKKRRARSYPDECEMQF